MVKTIPIQNIQYTVGPITVRRIFTILRNIYPFKRDPRVKFAQCGRYNKAALKLGVWMRKEKLGPKNQLRRQIAIFRAI